VSWNARELIGAVDDDFVDAVSQFLAEVEQRLVAAAQADTAFATEAAGHIISSGGKRFRPLLVVVASMLGEPKREDVVNAAVVAELTHVASLYHDDVMDDAVLRRGAPSANQRWGNMVAILVGDLLFARMASVLTDLDKPFAKVHSVTFNRLVQGQLRETVGPEPGADPVEHYLRVVSDKTGSLIAGSAVLGGMAAGLPEPMLSALAKFGEEIGVVFQLIDDLIDIESETAGKTPGTDLRAGVRTLPTLLVRRCADPRDARLLQLLDGELGSDEELAEALALLRGHRCMEEAHDEIRRRANLARSYLDPLPEGQARIGLAALCDAVVTRSS
jgi:heptaprenyl diphosphate synthase